LALVTPAAGAPARSPGISQGPSRVDVLAMRDGARAAERIGPAIYAAPVDEEEELEGGDQDEEFCPGPDPCLAPQARCASLSPLAIRCPGQSCGSDAAAAYSCAFAATLLAAPDAPCPALATCVQFLC
jgi:hypothetical protein